MISKSLSKKNKNTFVLGYQSFCITAKKSRIFEHVTKVTKPLSKKHQ